MKDHKDPDSTDSLCRGCIYVAVTVIVVLLFMLGCWAFKGCV